MVDKSLSYNVTQQKIDAEDAELEAIEWAIRIWCFGFGVAIGVVIANI